MIICSAAAALAATLIAGPVASADPAPPAGPSAGAAAPIAAPPDTAVYNPYYGPSGPDDGSAYTPVAMPVAAGPAPLMGQASEPKQAVYHTKGKDGVRHDVFVVPISDDPSKPITLPDFGFQKFQVTDKPRAHTPRTHKSHDQATRQHRGKKHRHGGKGLRRHR
ncbi:hypothetical protein IL992_04405 [Microbispora sp. NEAU-D428]|uniref:hypothetical protein n=1 Tax=Microbispora sitophila TaxID=2771537 RepID=UPI0018676D85|nr:hypothetical protein [Microbispora sitophila]MBE3008428.1 hypothetical protein [Microbispora sitophila]